MDPGFAFTSRNCWDPRYKTWKRKLRKRKVEKELKWWIMWFFSTHRFINPNACFVLFMDQALAHFINLIRSCFILIDTHRFIKESSCVYYSFVCASCEQIWLIVRVLWIKPHNLETHLIKTQLMNDAGVVSWTQLSRAKPKPKNWKRRLPFSSSTFVTNLQQIIYLKKKKNNEDPKPKPSSWYNYTSTAKGLNFQP